MYIFIDLETAGLDPAYNSMTSIWCVGIGLGHDTANGEVRVGEIECHEWSKSIIQYLRSLVDSNNIWVFHNAAYELPILRSRGINIPPGAYHDTMVMSHCLCPASSQYHSLEAIGERLEIPKIKYRQELIDAGLLNPEAPKGAEYLVPFNQVMARYNKRDIELTIRGFNLFNPEILRSGLNEVYKTFLGFTEYIIQMSIGGVWIDQTRLYQYMAELAMETTLLKQDLLADQPTVPEMKWNKATSQFIPKSNPVKQVEFSPTSDYHKIWALVQRGWEPTEYTPTGMPKVGVDQLAEFRLVNKFAEKLCNYTELVAKMSQAIQLLDHSGKKGLLRASWNLCGTRTHRISSNNPNCQNIGSAERDIRNLALRSSFLPSKGHKVICVDFSRIEVVILAYMLEEAGDSRLANAIREGKDVHQANADIWGCSRPDAKNGIFAISYGASATRLALTVKIPVEQAKAIIDGINKSMPLIQTLKDKLKASMTAYHPPVYAVEAKQYVQQGIVKDVFGSRYIYPDIVSKDREKSARAHRQAFNVKCQGSVGYLICKKANELLPYLMSHKARAILQVHDELVFECPDDQVESFVEAIKFVFTSDTLVTQKGVIPISVSIGIGSNWHEAKEK